MKGERLFKLLAVLVLTVILIWVVKNTYWETVEERTRAQGEALTNPFYAAQQFAGSLGAHTRLRHEMVSVPSRQTIIVIGAWDWSFFPDRRERLEQWVSSGGRLVVSDDLIADRAFADWTGIKRVTLDKKKNDPHLCTTTGPCPISDSPVPGKKGGVQFNICGLDTWTELTTGRKTSWRLHDDLGHLQVLRIPIGRGTVTMVNASPFGNANMLCADDALLFVAATELRRGDEIDFLLENRGHTLLQLLWEHGAAPIILAAVLLALWLWRSGVRFGPRAAPVESARRSLAEQIRGTGQFIQRFGGDRALYAATARALGETAASRVPHYERLSGEERIAAVAPLAGLLPDDLSAALADSATRRPHEVRKSIVILETARRNIASNLVKPYQS